MWVLGSLIFILGYTCYWYCTSTFGFWKKKGIPNPDPVPLFGNLLDAVLMKRQFGEIYSDLYHKYQGLRYFGVYKVRAPAIVVRDPGIIKDILIKDFNSFQENDFEGINDDVLLKNPFFLKGHMWKVVRTQLTPSFTSGKIKSMFPLLEAVGKDMTSYLDKETSDSSAMDCKELASKFTTDCVATCAYGLEGKSFVDPNAEFRNFGKKLMTPSIISGLQQMLVFMFPAIAGWMNVKFVPDDITQWFRTLVDQTVEYRTKNNIFRNDFMDLMIQLKSKPGEYEFTNEDITSHSASFFFDGFETSSLALTYTLYELAKNVDIQDKLRIEIDNVLKMHEGKITYDAIQDMPYLENVFLEALRKYPPATFMGKISTQKYTFPAVNDDGTGKTLDIDPGTSIIIPLYGIHYDEKYYPDPQKFDPDRFTEENKQTRPKCTFLTFGEGPRVCLGQRFGISQSKMCIVSILSKYELRVNKKTQEPLKMDPTNFLLYMIGGIWLDFYKRGKVPK